MIIKNIFDGRVLQLNLERASLPDGRSVDLEIIRHPGGACALPVHDDDNIILIRQYRHAAGGIIWELPAGRINDNEEPESCARRELKEETGFEAGKMLAFYKTYMANLNKKNQKGKLDEKASKKTQHKRPAAESDKVAEKPRRYKLTQESLSGRGSKLGSKVHGVREGASGYKPPEGASGKGEDSTRPIDSTAL